MLSNMHKKSAPVSMTIYSSFIDYTAKRGMAVAARSVCLPFHSIIQFDLNFTADISIESI